MKLFPYGHATHPKWRTAANTALTQIRECMANPAYASAPALGLIYITDHYAEHAQEILDHVSGQLPEVVDWCGTVGVGVASNNIEYFDEPGLVLMLCALPVDQYRVFSGVTPLPTSGFTAHTALVHADAGTPDVTELIDEMAQRTSSGYLFGGISSSRNDTVQFALSGSGTINGQGAASGVFSGGLSGVAFAREAQLLSRVTQGCQPISEEFLITACVGNVVTELNYEPALEVMLNALNVSPDELGDILAALHNTLVGLRNTQEASNAADDQIERAGQFGADVLVRHIIGLDPDTGGIVIADTSLVGMTLTFCQRSQANARADLTRVCAEIREELEPELETADDAQPLNRIAGAIYISCAGRGGPHFGAPSAEMQLVRRALGDVPLVGFFAGGEIARHHLHGYTGVLTVFTRNV